MSNKQTLIEQFLRECGKYTDTAQIPNELIEKYIQMEKEAIQTEYQDGRESVIIEHTAALSTSNASSYSDGYKEGYKRAIELTKWTITNLIPPHNENGITNESNISTTANTTSTTFLCTHFLSDASMGATLPRCIKCGKTEYQHPIISNTQ